MKIVELKTTLFEFELDRVMGDANSPRGRTKSGSCLVELITDEGLVGISIGGGNSIAQIRSLFALSNLESSIKSITLKFGGVKFHQRAIPFFIGVILGEFIIGSLWMIRGAFLGVPTYKFLF